MRKHIQEKHPEEAKKMARKQRQRSRLTRTKTKRADDNEKMRKRNKENRKKRTPAKRARDNEANKEQMKAARKKRQKLRHLHSYNAKYGYSSTPDFSSVGKWRPNSYNSVTSNKWLNHPDHSLSERFCYCWEFDGNNTAYCTCYETWKNREDISRYRWSHDHYIYKYKWEIIALRDDPVPAEQAKDKYTRRFRKCDKGTAVLRCNSDMLNPLFKKKVQILILL